MSDEAYIKTEEHMRDLATVIDRMNREALGGQRKGFVLMVFGFGAPGVSNYISNAERGDVVTALRELANRLEEGVVIPAAISNTIN